MKESCTARSGNVIAAYYDDSGMRLSFRDGDVDIRLSVEEFSNLVNCLKVLTSDRAVIWAMGASSSKASKGEDQQRSPGYVQQGEQEPA